MKTRVSMSVSVPQKSWQYDDAPKKKPKTKYQRKWEGTFGKHTARCHPHSFIKLASKEGKPILLLVLIGICGTFRGTSCPPVSTHACRAEYSLLAPSTSTRVSISTGLYH